MAPDVSPDLDSAYREAAALALADGRTKFAYACPEGGYHRNHQKKFGIIDATLESRGYGRCETIYHTPEDVADSIRSNPDAVDVVFCENDPFAIDVMARVGVLGLRFPEDVMVFGCDGTMVVPGLWTIKHDPREISLVVAGLVRRLADGERPTGQWLSRPKVVLGQ